MRVVRIINLQVCGIVIDFQELAEVMSVLEEVKVPYYIHIGVALLLCGMDGELDDCGVDFLSGHKTVLQKHLKIVSRGKSLMKKNS